MAGVLPPTALLLTHFGVVAGHFASYSEITRHLGISVDMETGVVTFMGQPQTPTYIVKEGMIINNHWKSAEDIIRDWSSRHLKLPTGYAIYRYLT